MVLPIFLQFLNDKFKKSFQIQFSVCGVFLVFSILLYLTGSYLAWIICAFFIIVLLLHYLLFEKKYRQHVIIFLGIASFVFLLYIWHTYGREIIEMQKMK